MYNDWAGQGGLRSMRFVSQSAVGLSCPNVKETSTLTTTMNPHSVDKSCQLQIFLKISAKSQLMEWSICSSYGKSINQYHISSFLLNFLFRRDARKSPHTTRVPNPYQTEEPSAPLDQDLQKPKHPGLPLDEWRALFEERFRNLRAVSFFDLRTQSMS